MDSLYPDFQALGIEVLEEIPEPPERFDSSGWEILTIFYRRCRSCFACIRNDLSRWKP